MAIQLIHDVSIFDRKSVLRKGILIGMKFLIISLKQFEKNTLSLAGFEPATVTKLELYV